MRFKVSPHNLGRVENLLACTVGCDIVQRAAPEQFAFTRQMLNPRRGTIIHTQSGGFTSRIAAVKAAVREFGAELREVLQLARLVTVRDASISTTQRFVEVTFADKRVDVFDNSVRCLPPLLHEADPLSWDLHPLPQWTLIGAGLVMRRYRNLLPPGMQVRDPLAAALDAVRVGAERNPTASC